jgi:hypothetical protein
MPSLFNGTFLSFKPSKRVTGGLFSVAVGGIVAALLSSPLPAAEVTFERLKNA